MGKLMCASLFTFPEITPHFSSPPHQFLQFTRGGCRAVFTSAQNHLGVPTVEAGCTPASSKEQQVLLQEERTSETASGVLFTIPDVKMV